FTLIIRYEKLKWFGAPDLMDIQYIRILLAAAKYCDPTRSLFKLALDLMRKEAPNVEPKVKLLICKAGVFEDLSQILEGKWATFTAEVVCTIVDGLLKDNKEGLEHALTSKMINRLKKVLSVEPSKIKRVHAGALARVVICGTDEQV
ncbi:MAG: hypothetical protein EZS28_049714, partial [Streblomastix strix]